MIFGDVPVSGETLTLIITVKYVLAEVCTEMLRLFFNFHFVLYVLLIVYCILTYSYFFQVNFFSCFD